MLWLESFCRCLLPPRARLVGRPELKMLEGKFLFPLLRYFLQDELQIICKTCFDGRYFYVDHLSCLLSSSLTLLFFKCNILEESFLVLCPIGDQHKIYSCVWDAHWNIAGKTYDFIHLLLMPKTINPTINFCLKSDDKPQMRTAKICSDHQIRDVNLTLVSFLHLALSMWHCD